MTSDIEEQIDTIINDHELRTGIDLGDEIDRESLKQSIKALITKEIKQAKVIELDEYIQWYMGRDDATIFTDRQVVEELLERINTLNKD